jgi:hypothetical protein
MVLGHEADWLCGGDPELILGIVVLRVILCSLLRCKDSQSLAEFLIVRPALVGSSSHSKGHPGYCSQSFLGIRVVYVTVARATKQRHKIALGSLVVGLDNWGEFNAPQFQFGPASGHGMSVLKSLAQREEKITMEVSRKGRGSRSLEPTWVTWLTPPSEDDCVRDRGQA